MIRSLIVHEVRLIALTIGFSYIIGRLIPLTPSILLAKSSTALLYSVTSTLVALLIFGYTKGRFTGALPLQSALTNRADRQPLPLRGSFRKLKLILGKANEQQSK